MTRKLLHDEISQRRFSLEELSRAQRAPIYVLLDNIRSMYNVGSIFRTADGARVTKLLLCGYTPIPPRKEIEKTALGATETVPWEYYASTGLAIDAMRSARIPICVIEHTDTSIPYYDVAKSDFPLCLVLGNEITGVSKECIEATHLAVDIPMFGMKQSLNVAVAFGIVVFEFARMLGTSE